MGKYADDLGQEDRSQSDQCEEEHWSNEFAREIAIKSERLAPRFRRRHEPRATISADVKRMANAICGNEHADPELHDLAVTIARWQLVMLKVRAARIAADEPNVDRLKELVPGQPTEEAWAQLDRYEQRAMSHRNQAIRMLDAISIATPFLDRKAKDTQ